MAAGLGAHVTLLDISLDRLRISPMSFPRTSISYSNRHNMLERSGRHDRIGAVLLTGAKAPKLVKRADLKAMKQGSVSRCRGWIRRMHRRRRSRRRTISRPMSWTGHPLAVAKHAGGVRRTSTLALTNATFPYAKRLAVKDGRTRARRIRAWRWDSMCRGSSGVPWSGGGFQSSVTDLKTVL